MRKERAMKYAYCVALTLVALTAGSQAQGTRVFRCPGNSYTNSESEAKVKGCKPMDGGNITVVEGTRVNGAQVKVATAPQTSGSGTRVDAGAKKARDTDAKAIIEAERKK